MEDDSNGPEGCDDASKLKALRRAIDVGLMQSQRGEYSSRSVMDIAADVLREYAEDEA